ncbi:MAG: hypothetical protein D6720_11915 [Gammaproteobacteria bacterium]|nr:MAG: hypothetical protein D6720_11915 [Gammaproteobacteria bacterium]
MRLKYLFIVSLLTCVQARALEFPLEVIEYIDNTRVVAFVSPRDIKAAGSWEPLHMPPPLTMEQALHQVWTALTGRGVPPEAIRLASIELKEFRQQPGRWHYLIRLKQTSNSRHPRFFVVLMNGKTVAAAREPQSYK